MMHYKLRFVGNLVRYRENFFLHNFANGGIWRLNDRSEVI